MKESPARGAARTSARFIWLCALFALGAEICGCAPHHYPTSQTPAPQPPATSAPSSVPASTPASQQSSPRRPPPRVPPGTYAEEGMASWYGVPYHGRRAANGEIYDMYKMTAAHRTLPFDSIVHVTNLKNGRTADVRITDRGPFTENRVIDLSLAAARALDMVAAGTARVRLELLAGSNPREGNFAVQVAAFQSRENADRMRARLGQRYQPVSIQVFDSPTGVFYRVRVGSEASQEAAKRLAARLASEENVTPFVVRLDP